MIREPKTMAELHKTREEHYELTKDKNLKSVIHEIAQESKAIVKKYNLKVKCLEGMNEKSTVNIV